MSVLPVPYISQIDEGRLAINDCGPACALMVARAYGKALDTSIDDLYRRHNLPDTGLAVSTIMLLLASGVPCHRATGSLAQLRRWIDERTPPILLVDLYGGHFVVATGYHDGGFTMHDPYWRGDAGAHITISDAEMARIWGTHGDQYDWTAIVPNEPLGSEEGDVMADIEKARVKIEEARAALTAALEALEGDAPTPTPGPVLEVYNTGGATLRVRETPNGPIIGALMPGQRVRELERRDGWVRHDAGGWSHGDYLRPT